MTIGSSIFLIAVGAILRFAVTTTTPGFNIHTVGLIVLLAGVAGLLISLFWLTTWRERRRTTVTTSPRERVVVHDRDVY
jgi:beta-lactamase regulating signal transducer with metallopeptidase domain